MNCLSYEEIYGAHLALVDYKGSYTSHKYWLEQ